MLRLFRVEKSGNLICWAAAEAIRVRDATKILGMVSLAKRIMVFRFLSSGVGTSKFLLRLRRNACGRNLSRQGETPAVCGRIVLFLGGSVKQNQGLLVPV